MSKRKIHELNNLYKLSFVDLHRTRGRLQIPEIPVTSHIPSGLINFKDAMRHNKFDKFVHFYLNDGEFECIWRAPERYINRLKKFSGILTPDFSLYTDMPTVVQAWNVYRSRILGKIFHSYGCEIIPTVSWSDSRSFSFAFDGIPKKSSVSVSSVGIWKNGTSYELFLAGLSAMIKKIKPCCIVFYGKIPQFDFGNIVVKQYFPDTFTWKNRENNIYYREK